MKWMTVFVMTLVLGCGGKKEEEKKVEEENKEEGGWGSKLSGLADKAKDLGDKAKEIGSEVGDKAKEVASGAEQKARELEIEKYARQIGDEVARRADGVSSEALKLGRDIKSKLAAGSKLAKYNYDLSIDASEEDEAAFEAKHAKLKKLEVAGYKVGFERRSQHPLGKVYKWQFVFGWRLPDGRTARLSLFTDDELEELMLATLMGELLPIATLSFK